MPQVELTQSPPQIFFRILTAAWDHLALAQDQLERKKLSDAGRALEECWQSLAKAFAVLYSGSPKASIKWILLQQILQQKEHFKKINARLLDDYLELLNTTGAQNVQFDASQLRDLLEQTQKFLEAAEVWGKQIAQTVYLTKEDQILLMRRQIIALITLVCVVVIVLLAYPYYLLIKPTHDYESSGQLFWVSTTQPQEKEENSILFQVFEDGQFHDYVIEFSPPLEINGLRFDPVKEKNTAIWIESVEYYAAHADTPIALDTPQNGLLRWLPKNDIQHLNLNANALYFETTGLDPYLKMTGMSYPNLSKVKIRMKVVLYKNFLQWIFS